MLKSITFSEFQRGIAPLWRADNPINIPIYNNPYRIISYPVDSQRQNIIYRCFTYLIDGRPAAYTSIYNISATVLRIRGIYVRPEFQGRGIGHMIWREAAASFPHSFYRVVGFWRQSSADRFIQHSAMSIVPQTDWIWSEFSKVWMRFLYWDRNRSTGDSQAFIDGHLDQYGFEGSQNLDRKFDPAEWQDYTAQHGGCYPDLKIDLNFD